MSQIVVLRFHLFISYTRTPDGPLANEIERFLESFHQSSTVPAAGEQLDPLQVCIDGSDFRMPPPDQGLADDVRQRNVLNAVYAHLAESKKLLVLCSRALADSR